MTQRKHFPAAKFPAMPWGKAGFKWAAGGTDRQQCESDQAVVSPRNDLLFNSVQAGDKVAFTVDEIRGVKTITKLQKQ